MGLTDARRLGLVQAALAGKITNAEGAQVLGLSRRQFKRLRSRVRRFGPGALVHGNRGWPSPRRLSPQVHARVVAWLKRPEVRLNDCHVADKLVEVEGCPVSVATVRRIRLVLGLAPKRKRRSPQHRRRRLREAREGAMVLIDGSPFAWLGDAPPPSTLVGNLDDATGKILALSFQPEEDLHGFATVLHQTFTTFGLPLVLYGDRTNLLVRSDDHWTVEEELQGHQHLTHLGQALHDLGVRYQPAYSPQAKGRIERLWGTLQDRLAVELRLRSITTLEQAQAFLPEFIADFNRRFAVPPRETQPVWRRPPRDLDLILTCRYRRTVARDNTVTLQERVIAIPPGPGRRSYAGCQVEVREQLDGSAVVLYQGRRIAEPRAAQPGARLAPRHLRRLNRTPTDENGFHKSTRIASRTVPRVKTQAPRTAARGTLTHIRRPAADHPWRRTFNPSPYRQR